MQQNHQQTMNPTSTGAITNVTNRNSIPSRGRRCRYHWMVKIPISQLASLTLLRIIVLLLFLFFTISSPICPVVDAFPIGKLLSQASLPYFVVRPFVRKLIVTNFSNNKSSKYIANNPLATKMRFPENLKRDRRWLRRSPLFSNINCNVQPNNSDNNSDDEIDNLIASDYRISDTTLHDNHHRGICQNSHHHEDHNHQNTADATTKFNGITRPVSTPIIVNLEYEDEKDKTDLLKENQRLLEIIHELEGKNQLLRYELSNRIVLEKFEGEGRLLDLELDSYDAPSSNIIGNATTEMLWCDELDDGQCPVEPTVSFGEALRDRAYWLVGLLILQSCSGIILARNEALLANHPFIIYFLTMLVGAGGNAGNQASVRVIRGLALGTLNEKTQSQFLFRELKMASALSLILSLAGFIRASAFRTPFPETIAVTASLFLIVFSSICLGAILPLGLKKLRVDPAHSSTTIQVVMDILGVVLAVVVSSVLLDSPIGKLLIAKLIDSGL